MMKFFGWFFCIFWILSFTGCSGKKEKKTIWAIPVYGQSLALGEEAIRITNFDSLAEKGRHRILTESLDEKFGYYADSRFKHWLKKMVHDDHRSFEISIYGMGEVVTNYFDKKNYGDSVMLCTFPEGQGSTSIVDLGRGSVAYKRFLKEIKDAYDDAKSKGWDFYMPVFCWMQGEDDIVWKTSKDYKKDLSDFQDYFNKDVKAITGQQNDIKCICYQTNCLTLAKGINTSAFNCRETYVPEAQMELIRDNKMFSASGPTYPYSFVNELVHIDGMAQKRLGYLAGLSVVRLMEGGQSKGLLPVKFTTIADTITIDFNVPSPPLVLDTFMISKASNYGFSVVGPDDKDILQSVTVKNSQVKLHCAKSPVGYKLRYAVNGLVQKSGHEYGPRGNLRDSQGDSLTASIQGKIFPLHNWCYQFDMLVQ